MYNVKLIRMHSGEDVVANIIDEQPEYIKIENAIVAIPTGAGQIGFAPWAPILSKNSKQISIDKRFVVFIAEVDEEVANQHKTMYGGVITKTSKLIV